MITYKVTIKEKGIPYLTEACYTTSNEDLDDICRFLGCKNYNVEWYTVEKVSEKVTLSDFFIHRFKKINNETD